jgi:hypothetical protein
MIGSAVSAKIACGYSVGFAAYEIGAALSSTDVKRSNLD